MKKGLACTIFVIVAFLIGQLCWALVDPIGYNNWASQSGWPNINTPVCPNGDGWQDFNNRSLKISINHMGTELGYILFSIQDNEFIITVLDSAGEQSYGYGQLPWGETYISPILLDQEIPFSIFRCNGGYYIRIEFELDDGRIQV